MLPIRTILHPTDLSAESAGAFQLACALARGSSARLVLLLVYPPPFNGAEAVDRARSGGIEEALRAQLTELKPDDPAVRVEYRAEEGRPADVIVRVARQIGADLIVMGTHGRGGAARALMGSVAETVNRKAACAVATVRQKIQTVAGRAASAPTEVGNVADAEAGPEDWRAAPGP